MKLGEYLKIMQELMAVFSFFSEKRHIVKLLLQAAVAGLNKLELGKETTNGAGDTQENETIVVTNAKKNCKQLST